MRDLLLGPHASDVFDAVVGSAGGVCSSAAPVQVRYHPGLSITVQYRASVAWGDEAEKVETLVAHSGAGAPSGTPVVEVDGTPISMWRYPEDPYLPGLKVASDPGAASRILEELGAPGGPVQLRRRAYRPGRRAVFEVVSNDARIFIKVVRPSRVERLQAIHRAAADHIPTPRSYGWAADLGLVALQAMPGETLRKAIPGGARSLPSGQRLIALLDRLPEFDRTEVTSTVARVTDHHRLISTVLPSLESRIDDLLSGLRAQDSPLVRVHGDFHSSQVLTQDGSIVGLIDLDTLGVGSRADDLATMLGQVSALTLGRQGGRYRDFGESLIRDFDSVSDPTDLRMRVAAVVLGFATGPFRVQQRAWEDETNRRLALAEQWLKSASKT